MFRNSVQKKLAHQHGPPGNDDDGGASGLRAKEKTEPQRPRRRLEPTPQIDAPAAATAGSGRANDDCNSFRASASKSLEGVPGMIHTIRVLQEKCQKAFYNEAFEELQVLILQDAECPSLRASEKTQFLQELLDVLANLNTAGMDNKIKLRFFEVIKRLASDTVQRSSSQTLFSSAEERIFGPLHEHKAALEAKLSSLAAGASCSEAAYQYDCDSDVFLIDKIVYNVEAAKSLLESGIQFVKTRKQKGKGTTSKLAELFGKIGGAATLDGECIGWLVAHGLKFAWQTANSAPSNRTAAQILVIEKYNDLILKQPSGMIFVEQAKLWIADLGVILSTKFADLRPQKDWLIAYACVECLLNIAFRFTEAQVEVLQVLSKPLTFKLRSSRNLLKWVRNAWEDTSDFQRRIRFKYLEALAHLALWGQERVRSGASEALDEHRSQGAPISNNMAVFWRFILAQRPDRYSEILCFPAAADFLWIETALTACKKLFMKEPLREANAILRIMNQQFVHSGTVDVNAGDLVQYTWPHVPEDIIQEMESAIDLLSGDYRTPDVCKRLFIRTVMLAMTCKLKSTRAPEHLGLCDPSSLSGPALADLSSEQVLAEDIVAFSGTSSASGSDDASQDSQDSAEGPLSNANGTSSLDDSVPQVTAEQLASVHESIRTIAQHVERGSASSSATGLRNVIVVGVTGSGKSTMVNSLAGCTIRTLEPEEAEAQFAPTDALKVVPISEGGARDPVTAIGNHAQESETEVLRAIEILSEEDPDQSFMLWDAPGFLDTHGPEINIANAVNLTNLLKVSQQNGLIVVVVLDAPSFTASRGSALKDTVKILVHLLGDEQEQLNNSFLSGTLFCVTKAPEAHRFPLKSLREWIVRAGTAAGLELEGNREQISIFDPLSRNSEGCGPVDLRKRLLGMRPLRNMNKVFETSLTEADKNLLAKIAYVLSVDVASSLEKCDFATLRAHLDLLNLLQVISNKDVGYYADIVFRSISDRATKWSYVVKDKVNSYTVSARREMRLYLDKLKQSQVLEDSLPPPFSIKALYTECYDKVQNSEKKRQTQETQELENLFTRAKANLRSALTRLSESNPDFFGNFNVSTWECNDCVSKYASVKEVQDLKVVLDKAAAYAAGRMPDQLYVFGEQGNLAELIHTFQDQVLQLFREAQHKSRGTVLDRQFELVLEVVKEQVHEELEEGSNEQIDFFSKAALLVSDVPSLVFHGMDPSAGKLHEILMELQQGHQATYKRRSRQLEDYFADVHQQAVDLKVDRAAKLIALRQDAFKKTVEGEIKGWFEKIMRAGKEMLQAELRELHSDYDQLWEQVLKQESLASVSEVKRRLRTRESKVMDELVLSADAYMNHLAADIKDTEMKINGKLEQLRQLSFEVVKRDYAHLKLKRIQVAELFESKGCGFGEELVNELSRLFEHMSAIDTALHTSLSLELDSFLELLMQTAIAENAAVHLTEGYAFFEDGLRSRLPELADSIVEGKVDLLSELTTAVKEYRGLWDMLRSRCKVPSVGDTIKRLERQERALTSRLGQEAAQFLRNLASDRKQRDLKFEQAFTEIKKQLEVVLHEHHAALMAVQIDAVSELSNYGFNDVFVGELSSILAIVETDDRPTYLKRSKQLRKFFKIVRELAEAWHHLESYRKGVNEFVESIRSAIHEKAPVLAPGGQYALQKELDSAFPKHREHWTALVEGPQASQPRVQTLAAAAHKEKESLMVQLERDLSNHVKNLLADRKQVHQQFGALVLQLLTLASSDAVEQHCEALALCSLGVHNVLVLCDHGFEKEPVHEVHRLLKYFFDEDTAVYPECEAELLKALQTIQGTAKASIVQRFKAKALSQLEENKTLLLSKIDSTAAGIVEGTIDVEEELSVDVTELLVMIMSLEAHTSVAAQQQIEAEVNKSVESVRSYAKERFDMLEALANAKRREAITGRLTRIITQLPKHHEQDQRDLALALDELLAFEGRSPEYKAIVAAVSAQFDTMQERSEIERMLGSGDFVGLNARLQMLQRLTILLKQHCEVPLKITEAVKQQMSQLLAEVGLELDADISSSAFLQFTRLRYFCTVFDAVKDTYKNSAQIREALRVQAFNKLNEMLNKVRCMVPTTRDILNQEGQQNAAKLLIKGYGVSFELKFVDHFKAQVQEQVIAKCVDKEKYLIGMALMQYATEHHSEDDGVKEMASIIIDTFPAFKSFNIALFNAKAGSVTFSDALAKLHCTGPCKHTALTQAYESYFQQYDGLVNQIVQNLNEFPREKVKGQIVQSSKVLARCAMKLSDNISECGRLLGLVCGLWTYLSCEGKSSGLEKRQVLQPHSTQVLGILRLLGLDQNSLMNHLIQIDTGEGKSIALGFTATVLALLGFRVDVVCYSRYLSERDHQAFLRLFQFLDVESKVSYSDFTDLSNRIMKDGANDFPDMRKVMMSFLAGKKYNHTPKQQSRSVLLMDEVDVFFSDAFYGKTFNPVERLDAPESHELVQLVWKNRGTVADLDELLSSSEAKKLRNSYPMLSPGLLQVHIRELLQQVKLFPISGSPKLEGYPQFVVDKKKQRIGYLDPVSGVPQYNTFYGYVTAFTYLHCVESQQLELEKVKGEIVLRMDCGKLLYSRIPTLYTVCLGMTGTLDCLSEVQNDLLTQFGFNLRTRIPSTFKRGVLNEKENADDVRTIVEVGSYNEYFETLKREIESQVVRGRATLVVFKDESQLERFEKEIKLRQPNLKQYQTPKVLSDRLSSSERDYVVIQAIRRFATTFMTRSYGRGTDFVCRDEGLVKNHGVHLIVTFYPQDESENKQINGRTCRQDNPGSARKILFEDDLKYLEATENDMASTGLSWDEYLSRRRMAKEADRYKSMEKSEKRNARTHSKTLEAYEAVKNGNWDVAAVLIQQLAEGIPEDEDEDEDEGKEDEE